MARTFLQLQEEVLAHGFSSSRYRDRVKVWLNEALRRVARAVRDPQASISVAYVAGQDTYDLGVETGAIISVRDEHRETQLVAVPQQEMDLRDETQQGVPREYVIGDGTIQVWPAPNVAGATEGLEVRYRALPAELTDSPDTTFVPDEYADVLIAYALQRAYRSEDDFEAATFYSNEFNTSLTLLRNDLGRPDESVVRRVGDRRPDLRADVAPRFNLPS